jgi:hypothetical protein
LDHHDDDGNDQQEMSESTPRIGAKIFLRIKMTIRMIPMISFYSPLSVTGGCGDLSLMWQARLEPSMMGI